VEKSIDCGTMKVYIPRVGQACGELYSVSGGHK
jgi:hypothetical protein